MSYFALNSIGLRLLLSRSYKRSMKTNALVTLGNAGNVQNHSLKFENHKPIKPNLAKVLRLQNVIKNSFTPFRPKFSEKIAGIQTYYGHGRIVVS